MTYILIQGLVPMRSATPHTTAPPWISRERGDALNRETSCVVDVRDVGPLCELGFGQLTGEGAKCEF